MTVMRFVDTNILIYAIGLQPAPPEKKAIAREILTHGDIALSVQVLQEFYVQATHARRPDALSHDIAMHEISRCAGSQFDPDVANEFAEAIEQDRQDGGLTAAERANQIPPPPGK